jgi:TonB family protein
VTSEETHVEEVGLLTVFTLVLWSTCLAVGATGLLFQARYPAVPATQPVVDQVTTMDVDVTKEASAIPDAGPPPPDPTPAETAALPTPPAPAVALASPAIAFALPMDGPVRIVAAEKAPVHQVITQTPTVVRLTPGQGEGYRPMPEYPIEARLAHQQGSLVVTLTVGQDGRVISAHVSSPSPWPILNQTALRTVREEWMFPSGPVRTYEAPFEFKLTDQ